MNIQHSLTPDHGVQKLLSCSFNQDQGCFTISYETGFRVYNTDPMELNVKREWEPHSHNKTSKTSATPTKSSSSSSSSSSNNITPASETGGGIGIAQMLHRTNYLALVGGGRNPKFPQNKVIIWDDLKRRPALSLEFLSPVLNVLLSRTHIVVVLAAKVHVFAFSSPPTRIASYETADNPHGIAVLSNNILAFPSRLDGQIQVVYLDFHSNNNGQQQQASSQNSPALSARSSSPSSSSAPPPPMNNALVTIIRAHKGPIRCLALNRTGTVIASASDVGTIIRLHSTKTTALLHEFRRGLDRAIIYSMAFSPNQEPNSPLRLAVLSDKNTLHIFDATSVAGVHSNQAKQQQQQQQTSANSSLQNNHSNNNMSSNVSTVSSSYQHNNNNQTAYTSASSNSGGSSIIGNNNNNNNTLLSSNHGSGHHPTNRRHLLGRIPLLPRYFYSEWSFASARVDGFRGVLGWPSDDAVVVVWIDACKWEKYVIVEREAANNVSSPTSDHHHRDSNNSSPVNGHDSSSDKYELVREAWRGFEGLSYD